MAEKMGEPDPWSNSKYLKASSHVTFAKCLPCLTSAWRPWVTERSTAGGPGLSLACWELREAWLLMETFWRSTSLCGFLLWGLTSQLSQELLSKKWLNLCSVCWVWKEVAGSIRSPTSILLCSLHPQMEMPHWEAVAWFHLLSDHRAVLWQSFCTLLGRLSAPFFSFQKSPSFSFCLLKRHEVQKGSGGSK